MQFTLIPRDDTLIVAITLGQSGSGSNDNKGVLHNPQGFDDSPVLDVQH